MLHPLGLCVSADNVIDTGLCLKEEKGTLVLEGDVQQTIWTVTLRGMIRYFPETNCYGVLAFTYKKPNNRLKFYIVVDDLVEPANVELKSIGWAESQSPSRLSTAEVARFLIDEAIFILDEENVPYQAWNIDQWLAWQLHIINQSHLNESVQSLNPVVAHPDAHEDDPKAEFAPPFTAGYTVIFADGSMLMLSEQDPEVNEAGIHYVRDSVDAEGKPTYRSIEVGFLSAASTFH